MKTIRTLEETDAYIHAFMFGSPPEKTLELYDETEEEEAEIEDE